MDAPPSVRRSAEHPDYLATQLITYLGNKRALLSFIGRGVALAQERLGRRRLTTFDVFSGSGIVSRFLKQHSGRQYANDMEDYAATISRCYLANARDVDAPALSALHERLLRDCQRRLRGCLTPSLTALAGEPPGFISEYYAPRDMTDIQPGERCFYTPYNACYLDCMRQAIARLVPPEQQPFFIAPLLAEASVHANTGGVFKGFYKNSRTGLGKFGGNGSNALTRIQGHITLPFPVFSRYRSHATVLQGDANALAAGGLVPHVDVAYIDPPYNQHPYGSNYFMLNLLAGYQRPDEAEMSRVSGIPRGWNRSLYNKRRRAAATFLDLAQRLDARFLLVSFNNEGFISEEEMVALLGSVGTVTVLEADYTAYRASRNLSARNLHTKEFLYIVEKR